MASEQEPLSATQPTDQPDFETLLSQQEKASGVHHFPPPSRGNTLNSGWLNTGSGIEASYQMPSPLAIDSQGGAQCPHPFNQVEASSSRDVIDHTNSNPTATFHHQGNTNQPLADTYHDGTSSWMPTAGTDFPSEGSTANSQPTTLIDDHNRHPQNPDLYSTSINASASASQAHSNLFDPTNLQNLMSRDPQSSIPDISAHNSPYLSSHGSPFLNGLADGSHKFALNSTTSTYEGSEGMQTGGQPPHPSASSPQPGPQAAHTLEGLEEAFALGLPLFSSQSSQINQLPIEHSNIRFADSAAGVQNPSYLTSFLPDSNPNLKPGSSSAYASPSYSDEPQTYGDDQHAESSQQAAAAAESRTNTYNTIDSESSEQDAQLRRRAEESARRMASLSSNSSIQSFKDYNIPTDPSRQNSLTTRWLNLDSSTTTSSSSISAAVIDPTSMPPFPVQMQNAIDPSRPWTADRSHHFRPTAPHRSLSFQNHHVATNGYPVPRTVINGRVAQDSPAKSQSPPLLIIPDPSHRSQASASKPAGYSTSGQPSTQNNLLGIPSGGNSGGGSSFLSPIGPGGPSINIVPSTPTSGLKDARGIWEMMVAQAESAKAKQHSAGNPPSSAQGVFDQAARLSSYLTGNNAESGPRRASFNGVETTTPVMTTDTGMPPAVPSTAPLPGTFSHAIPGSGLVAPPQRQRSMSESALNPIVWSLSAEEIQRILGSVSPSDLMPNGSAQSVEGAGVNPQALTTAAMDGSALDSRPGSPSPWLASAHSPAAGQGPHSFVPSTAPPTESSFVLAGPEAYGANFIVGNDGNKIYFDMPAFDSRNGAINPNALGSESASYSSQDLLAPGPFAQHRRARSLQERELHAFSAGGSQDLNALLEARSVLDESGSGAARRASFASARSTSPYGRMAGSPRGSVSAGSDIGFSSIDYDYASDFEVGQSNGALRTVLVPPMPMPNQPVRAKVTTPATEMASRGRRTTKTAKLFKCPMPGCTSTFTRQFNLKGHIRSHNEERPFKCSHEGCDKSFARAHDAKRHSLLHAGKKPFECEACHRTFARFDALSRHHKTESGADCALRAPLPTNEDGSISESRYKAHMRAKETTEQPV